MPKVNFRNYSSLFLLFLIFTAGVLLSNHFLKGSRKLKIYNPIDVDPALVDSALLSINKHHRISDFELINQDGNAVSQKNFEGKIYVADFFFTTCSSICPRMSSQLHRVSEKFSDEPDVMILSHTVMPEVDSVYVLAEYAKHYHADSEKWMFVTGEKKKIYELARKSYLAVKDINLASDQNGDEHDFIHTENFILVDKNKRIRGFYDGTSMDDVNRLIEEMEILLRE